MYTSVPAELQFFLFSTLAGLFSALLYDVLRISRRVVKASDTIINIEDIIFFACAGFLVFIAAYLTNSGEIRWQSFIGFALGIALYIIIVRNRLLNVSTVIIKLIVKFTGIIISVLLFPLKLILKIFRKPVSVVAWYTGKGVKRVKSAAKSRRIKLRILMKNLFYIFRKK